MDENELRRRMAMRRHSNMQSALALPGDDNPQTPPGHHPSISRRRIIRDAICACLIAGGLFSCHRTIETERAERAMAVAMDNSGHLQVLPAIEAAAGRAFEKAEDQIANRDGKHQKFLQKVKNDIATCVYIKLEVSKKEIQDSLESFRDPYPLWDNGLISTPPPRGRYAPAHADAVFASYFGFPCYRALETKSQYNSEALRNTRWAARELFFSQSTDRETLFLSDAKLDLENPWLETTLEHRGSLPRPPAECAMDVIEGVIDGQYEFSESNTLVLAGSLSAQLPSNLASVGVSAQKSKTKTMAYRDRHVPPPRCPELGL